MEHKYILREKEHYCYHHYHLAGDIFPHALEDVPHCRIYTSSKQTINKQNQDDCKHNQRNEFL